MRYREVYPGVDLVYYGDQGQLEYDFVVAPGACPQVIQLVFSGIKRMQIDASGDLLLDTEHGELRQHRPQAYQLAPDGRRTITGSYQLDADGHVGFEIGDYDTSLPLVIDPVLSYSTYLGGNRWDAAHGIAVDTSGNVYVAGETFSTNFPAPDGSGLTLVGRKNVFVAKLNPSGTALVYSTLIGGSQIEWGQAIALDAGGNAYITGVTYSPNFPVTAGAFSTIYGGEEDVFVVKLNPAGALVYSTYLGAPGRDFGTGIAVDSSGNTYVTGYTTSTNFPVTTGAIQSAHRGGYQDVFVTKLNPAGSALVYSTYIGGSGNDTSGAIAVDGAGNACIIGGTDSGDFPLVSPLQASRSGGSDAFVLKINPAGNALVFSTYLGGNGLEYGTGIALDSTGAIYVTGSTNSTDFPVSGSAPQRVNAGSSDAFVTKLSPGGNRRVYSTYLGGSDAEGGMAIAVDRAGNAWVGGVTYSANFPLRSPTQSSFGGITDGFVATLNALGTTLLFSTFVGGSADDYIYGIALDSSGNGYVTGSTLSSNFPATTGVFQPQYAGGGDAFVGKITGVGAPPNPSFDMLVTPNSGSGASQAFDLAYTDSHGLAVLNRAYLLINYSFSYVNACSVRYDPLSNALWLLSDSGSLWLGPYSPGATAMLQNSQCLLNVAATSITSAGNTFTLHLPLSFTAAFNGAKILYMTEQDSQGLDTGWQPVGSWTVPIPAWSLSASPNSGSGASQAFDLAYADSHGLGVLNRAYLLINSGFSYVNACSVRYDPLSNALWLLNDSGSLWLGPYSPGATAILQNSQCSLNVAATSVTSAANTLTLHLPLSFTAAFNGAKILYMTEQDSQGLDTGWQPVGSWTVQVWALSASPNSGSGTSQAFDLAYTDSHGLAVLSRAYLLINSSFNYVNACVVRYDPLSNALWLLNDSGSLWLGPYSPGTTAMLQNSQCSLNVAATSVTSVGNTLTLHLPLSFTAAFNGAKILYMTEQDSQGLDAAWQPVGSWTVR